MTAAAAGAPGRSSPTAGSPGTWACLECDLLCPRVALPAGAIAHCRRCGATLARGVQPSVTATLALTATAAVLLALTHGFPLMELRVQGDRTEATVAGAAAALYGQGMTLMALLVAATTLLLPWIELALLATLLVPLARGRPPEFAGPGFRALVWLKPWNMIEVFLLGLLVAVAKLGAISDLRVGTAAWALIALVIVMATIGARLRPESFWSWVEQAGSRAHSATPVPAAPVAAAPVPAAPVPAAPVPTAPTPSAPPGGAADASVRTSEPSPTAASRGLAVCRICTWVQPDQPQRETCCDRCGAPIALRSPADGQTAAACLFAAAVLYIPANVLPVMHTRSLFGDQGDTIVSGVVHLAESGSWPTALLVFFASVIVPVMKLLAMGTLLHAAHQRSAGHRLQRSRLFRFVEFVGRWSMLDIYVVALLVTLVQLRGLASIHAGPGGLAFGAVVVLTMIAARRFDPRRLWDPAGPAAAPNAAAPLALRA